MAVSACWKAQRGRLSEPEHQRTLRKFSNREAEILECLTRGEANKLIARKFDITEATVKVHIKAILRKIQVKNRTQAAIWAQANLPPCRRDYSLSVPPKSRRMCVRLPTAH